MNVDGSDQTQLTDNPSDDSDPAFSPDGTRLTFSSNRDGNWEIYIMNVDGSNVVRLTNNDSDDAFSTFSPDGSEIVFHSYREDEWGIFIMKADGSGETKLAQGMWPRFPAAAQ
jgi:TolB protein